MMNCRVISGIGLAADGSVFVRLGAGRQAEASCLVLCSDGGWPVDGCYAGSPAEEAGIVAGDHIREIGKDLDLNRCSHGKVSPTQIVCSSSSWSRQ